MRWAVGLLAGRGSESSAKKPRGLVFVGGVVLLFTALLYILLHVFWCIRVGSGVVAVARFRGVRLLKTGAAMGGHEDENEHGLLRVKHCIAARSFRIINRILILFMRIQRVQAACSGMNSFET